MTNQDNTLKFCAQCPSSIMRKVGFSHVVIDVCENCWGIWLDDGELQSLVQNYGMQFRLDDTSLSTARSFLQSLDTSTDTVPTAESQRAQALLCPICHSICFPTIYGFESGIIINRCMQGHGVFLDQHELEAILVYSQKLLKGTDQVDLRLPVVTPPGKSAAPKPAERLTTRRRPNPSLANDIELMSSSRAKPRMRTTRSLKQPVFIDVKITISRTGNLFFDAVRSPQGDWYPVKKGGSVKIPDKKDHYWVELEHGGALVLKKIGLRFEWVLVGATKGQ